jgi:hypothetical protein
MARYFLDFLSEESCGKCLPCREGIRQMLNILHRITAGNGRDSDIELLEELSKVVCDASLCALGATAPNPVLTTIKYFRDEYEAHIKERRCPAKVCKPLVSYYIEPDKCQACLICLEVCPPHFAAVVKLSGEPIPPSPPIGAKVIRKRQGE